jgi:hypothetical protein
MDVTTSQFRPATALAQGVHFWRLFGQIGATTAAAPGPTWEFFVRGRDATTDASWGTVLDVNGDGYADVIAPVIPPSGMFSNLHLFYGSASGLVTSMPFDLGGTYGFVSAGDVNGDGYGDLLVVGGSYIGIYPGGPAGITTTILSMVTVLATASSGAAAGDVNGDGYADVIVGTSMAVTGSASVYLGSASGLQATAATTLSSPAGESGFGTAIAGACDVNSDGYADIIVGTSVNAVRDSYAHVYLGSSSGIVATPQRTLHVATNDLFGQSVACGDVNGDGWGDVIVGAPSGGATGFGAVYTFHGGPAGIAASPAASVLGMASGSLFGNSFAVGDLNGDGYSDVVVGAPYGNMGGAPPGSVYAYLGGSGGIAASPIATLTDGVMAGNFASSVVITGDINLDGFADVVIRAPGSGHTYVYQGTSSGVSASPASTL